MTDKKNVEIKPGINWIGVLDRDIVSFDIVMETRHGTTYNSYFIRAQKKAVIDTVKEDFWDTYLEKIRLLTDPSEIEYIICTHSEPDHSGNIKNLLKIAPRAIVAGSGQALNYLQEMIGHPFKSLKLKDGDILDLGNRKLRVIGAPNLHWPDSIYVYLEEDNLLFTCDSFGSHFCSEEVFDDKAGDFDEAFRYYFDVILKPFSKFMLKAIEKIQPLDINAICPGHGPVLRSNWKKYVDLSFELSSKYMETVRKTGNRVLIAYISAYGYTGEMANIIARGLSKTGEIEIDMVDIEHITLPDLEEKIVKSNAIIIGSPTINQNTLLPVYKLFGLVNPIRDKGKLAAVFGSFGWSGEAVKLIENHLRNLKFNVVLDGISEKFYPNQDKSQRLIRFGEAFGKKLMENPVTGD